MAPKIKVQDNLVSLSMQRVGENKMLDALTEIGKNEKARAEIVKALKKIEKDIKLPQNRTIREELTGPMADALYKESGVLSKKLKDGTIFNFRYRSKIARDFVLSPDEKPDHVFEPQTTKLFIHLARKAKNIIIGGAYAGDHAIVGAKVMHKHGVIHGFEPSDEQRKLLVQNAKANKVSQNIKAVGTGLWSKELELELVGDDAFAHAVPLRGKKTKKAISFPATSIERYAAKNKIENFDVILMDIEGSELPALKGAEKFLRQPKGVAPNIIFELHKYYMDWSKGGLANTEIVKYLEKFGYHVYALRDFQSNVPMAKCKIELIEPKDAYLKGPPHGFNMLAVKDKSILKPSLFRFVKKVSPKLLLHKDPALHWPTEWR